MHGYLKAVIVSFSIAVAFTGCAPSVAPQPSTDARMAANRLVDQGVYFMRTGELARAEASFYAAQEVAPLAAAIDGLGCIAFLRRDFTRSEDLFRQALAMDPHYHRALSNLALLYEVTGRRAGALKLYQRAIELEPKNIGARNNFAGLLYDYGLGDGSGRDKAVLRSRGELLKAQAVLDHPLVQDSLRVVE